MSQSINNYQTTLPALLQSFKSIPHLTILSNEKSQTDTGGFNHQLLIAIANTKPDAQGHNLVQSVFSGINEKLRNVIALNSWSAY
ncbi:uncharacterized protein EAE98_003316 [Botrytis deweyae]|uniref:Stress-response A/B barrel domain-containing protein n=1 Tax=Botrytis deweyae TaxID=2478750 RepID=A0ABQ7IT57_9HELO|nr:uncharacterized protein EAE98_003316 [Botrytis deweyae]KAF7933607.1 hypothetical protein EAE98_003316 [Botrytis deweyae]